MSSSCKVHAPQLVPHLSALLAKATAEKAPRRAGPSTATAAACPSVSDDALVGTIVAIAAASATVAVELRHTIVEKKAHENDFGDAVLSVDLVADAAIAKTLKKSPYVMTFASEEHPVLVETEAYEDVKKKNSSPATASPSTAAPAVPTATTRTRTAALPTTGSPTARVAAAAAASATSSAPLPETCVTFDPLDGSSIMDSNFSVGTIYAVWAGSTPIGQRCGDLVASVIVVYGPRCLMFVAEPRVGVFAYMLYDDQHWHLLQKNPFTVAPKAKIFSPGNLRAIQEHRGYRKFIQSLVIKRGLTLRYTGGMVPDCMQILVKGNGLFTTPIAPSFKVKLRVCFECAPIAFMVHCAGGWSVCDGQSTAEPRYVPAASSAAGNSETAPRFAMSGGSYLDVLVTAIDQRSAIGVGSASDVVAYWWAVRGAAAVPNPKL